SAYSFIQNLNESDDKPDKDLLRNIFYIPTPSNQGATPSPGTSGRNTPGKTLLPDAPEIEPQKRRFRLTKTAGGFTITPGNSSEPLPYAIEILVAYDIRAGNPIKKYTPDDFRFSDGEISLEAKGMHITTLKDNKIVAKALEPEFKLQVNGFDLNRDLYVTARVREAADDSQV